MSPPDTDTERQARRHRPALIGIAAALIVVAAAALIALLRPPAVPAGDQAAPVAGPPANPTSVTEPGDDVAE